MSLISHHRNLSVSSLSSMQSQIAIVPIMYFTFIIPLLLFSFTPDAIAEFEKQSYEQMNNDRALTAVYEGSLDELETIFSDENLAILTAGELRKLRNMIFAQHGYIFKSQDLQEWYGKFYWYEPLTTNVNDYLTMVDTFNISKIRAFESAHTRDEDIKLADDDLVGIWHVSPIVAAGYGDLLYFFSDHTFRINYNQMDWSKRLTSMSAEWSIDMNALILDVTEKTIIIGGEIVEPTASCASEFAIEGGEVKKEMISPGETYIYPISALIFDDLSEIAGSSVPRIVIGTTSFWKFSDNPELELH